MRHTEKKFGPESNQDVVVAGFSAGALIMTPTIEICNFGQFDENKVNLKDMSALSFVNFEVLPHYEPQHGDLLKQYQSHRATLVKPIADNDFILVDK